MRGIREDLREMKKPGMIALSGILIALCVVLGLLRIQITRELRISVGFVAMAILAMLGGWAAVPAAAIADILALLVNPSGAYYFGFTLTAMIEAAIYVLFFRKCPTGTGWGLFSKENRGLLLRCFGGRLLVDGLCNAGLNSFWLYLYYGKAFSALLPVRAVKNAILLIPETVLLFFALKAAFYAYRRTAGKNQ